MQQLILQLWGDLQTGLKQLHTALTPGSGSLTQLQTVCCLSQTVSAVPGMPVLQQCVPAEQYRLTHASCKALGGHVDSAVLYVGSVAGGLPKYLLHTRPIA